MRQGSFTHRLSLLAVGERTFFESTKDNAHNLQRQASHPELRRKTGGKYTTRVWTAVGQVGEAVVLVSVERTE